MFLSLYVLTKAFLKDELPERTNVLSSLEVNVCFSCDDSASIENINILTRRSIIVPW